MAATQPLPAREILDYLAGLRSNMASMLRWLALAESPSLVPEAQEPVFSMLSQKLAELDYQVLRQPGQRSGGCLYARPRQRVRHRPGQLLVGHADTVWPLGSLQHIPVGIDDGKMTGPGVYDMKGGLVQIIFALQALRELGVDPPLTPVVLINSDEEVGSPESLATVRLVARHVSRAFVLEPSLGPFGRLKTARKGVMRFDIVIHGKAAHAGLAPEEGVSAILELSFVIQKLFALNDPTRGVTVNVGAVDGGFRPNVVAPRSQAQVDVRVPTRDDAMRIRDQIMALETVTPGTRIQIEQVEDSPPLERTPRNRRLWEQARVMGQLIGLELEEATAGGGSDGNTTSLFAATLDGLGPVGGGAHAPHEFVVLDSLVQRTALLALLLLSPCDQGDNSLKLWTEN